MNDLDLDAPTAATDSGNAATVAAEPGATVRPRRGISRRVFLVRGSLAAGVAAALGSVPGMGSLLTSTEADSTELAGPTGSGAEAAATLASPASGPLVAHVLNDATGEISLYQGTTQVVTRNLDLARALSQALSSKP
jgi:hypothetical protein